MRGRGPSRVDLIEAALRVDRARARAERELTADVRVDGRTMRASAEGQMSNVKQAKCECIGSGTITTHGTHALAILEVRNPYNNEGTRAWKVYDNTLGRDIHYISPEGERRVLFYSLAAAEAHRDSILGWGDKPAPEYWHVTKVHGRDVYGHRAVAACTDGSGDSCGGLSDLFLDVQDVVEAGRVYEIHGGSVLSEVE